MLRSALAVPILAWAFAGIGHGQTPFILTVDNDQLDAGHSVISSTIAGSGFVSGSVALWGSTPLATTFSSSVQLQAVFPAALMALSGKYPITVRNPNGTVSNSYQIYVQPVLSSIFPTAIPAGLPSATVQISGVGFTPSDAILLSPPGGTPLSTTYLNSTTLTTLIPAADLSKPLEARVLVTDVVAGVVSRELLLTIGNPPILKSLSPASATMVSPAFLLTINGSGFQPGATATYNLAPLPIAFVNSTQLTAFIQPGLLNQPGASPGLLPIQITNPDGGLSNSLNFTVTPPVPVISSLSPSAVYAGGPDFTLTVNGTGFYAHSTVWFCGAKMATNVVSSTQLTAAIPAARIFSAQPGSVYVYNDGFVAPSTASPDVPFAINPPSLNSVTPASVKAGSAAFLLTANGAGFYPGDTIQWNGAPLLGTAYVSPTQLSATVNAALVASAGQASIAVSGADGSLSTKVPFSIDPLLPVVTAISPTSISAGAPPFALTVRGLNFVSDAVVQWNGSPLATAFVSPTQLTATVPSNLVAAQAAAALSVLTRGGLSNPVAFTVTVPLPFVDQSAIVNSASGLPTIAPGSLITIYGANLATQETFATAFPLPASMKGTSIAINGAPVPLLYAGPHQINAQVPFDVPVGPATLVVSVNAASSPAIPIVVAATGPGTLMLPQTNHAVGVNLPDGTLNSSFAPAIPGQYVTVYLTGQGAVDPAVPAGTPASADPLSRPLAAVDAWIGGQPADIQFAGLAPGFAGLLQVNLKIPAVLSGEQTLDVAIGGIRANTATLSIGAPQLP
jgi:uncharacterized protein (TIGR03437 family)